MDLFQHLKKFTLHPTADNFIVTCLHDVAIPTKNHPISSRFFSAKNQSENGRIRLQSKSFHWKNQFHLLTP
jgi:hypothetical protein